jgi:MFS family permease
MEYKWTVLTVTTVGVLMSGIDDRIVIVGLPQVAAALHADAEQAIWFTQSYALTSTIFLLFIGRITDMWGRIKVYNVGFIIFTVGSALTSLSLTPNEVIAFRMVQGLGASMLFTNSAALIADSTPAKELGLHLGVNNLAYRFGAMAGLTLSGVILAFVDWRALFYINVPIGIFGTIWAYKRLKEMATPEKGAPFDWVGFITFTTFITSFLLALTYAAYGLGEEDFVIVLSLIATGTFISFLKNERKRESPLLDLGLLKIKEFTGAVMAQLLNAITWGSMLLLLSLFSPSDR